MINVSDHISLREVLVSDEKLLLNWSNDPQTRKWSFNSNTIIPSEHKIWFKNKLNNQNVLIWILENDNKPAGLVRLEKDNDKAVLNYLICPEERGKGLASPMLIMAMKKVKAYWKNIKVLAYTLPKNIASIRSLEKAGFTLKSSSSERNCYGINIF